MWSPLVTFSLLLSIYMSHVMATQATTSSFTVPDYCSKSTQFYCHLSDQCKPSYVRCDGTPHCEQGEDEHGCASQNCTEANAVSLNKFFCKHTKTCLPATFKCDGYADCKDPADDSAVAEDEADCKDIKCTDSQYACMKDDKVDQCVVAAWRCDGQVDCHDGADEQNCYKGAPTCPPNQFSCNDTNTSDVECITNAWVCDGEEDCSNGFDEANCTKNSCPEGRFMCTAEKMCMTKRWRCDGDLDCASGEDESEEVCKKPPPPVTNKHRCTTMEFKCTSGPTHCIIGAWKCDGSDDCADGSDEADAICPKNKKCADSEFKCEKDNTCIPKFLTCSGKNECTDGADEKLGSCHKEARRCDLTKGEFSCRDDASGICIPFEKVCDGKQDCQSNRDENQELYCGANPISDYCTNKTAACHSTDPLITCRNIHSNLKTNQNRTIGFVCVCPKGYDKINSKCVDRDECKNKETPVCDHICVNEVGGYKCECNEGYHLQQDGRSCKVEGTVHPKLLFTNRHEIRSVHIHGPREYMPLIDSKAAVALDFDYVTKEVFFSDMEEKKLFKFKLPTSDSEKDLIGVDLKIPGIQTPDGLAYDWIYKHLYWTDTKANTINMACIDDEYEKRRSLVLYKNADPKCASFSSGNRGGKGEVCIDEPRAVAVHPRKGWVFWSDWGVKPHIVLAALDGSHKEMIAYNTDNNHNYLRWPNGLTLDLSSESERLYWIDAKLHGLFTCTINRCIQDINVLVYDREAIKHPFSITVFENKLYWSDWFHKHIVSANKYTGGNITKVISHLDEPMDLKVYHPMVQQQSINHCQVSKGQKPRCEQICVPKPWSRNSSYSNFSPMTKVLYSCLCSDGYKVSADGRTCDKLDTAKPLKVTPHVERVSSQKKGMNVGTVAAIASTTILVIAVIVAVSLLYVVRRVRRNKSKSMNFDNPIYKRTTEDKLELPRHEYQPAEESSREPSAIVPLTSSEGSSSMYHEDV